MSEPLSYPDPWIKAILARTRTVALVGASANPMRPSHFVLAYLARNGYEVWPVNPGHAGNKIAGLLTYAGLDDLPGTPDMVDVFRAPEAVPGIADQAIEIGAKCLWLQLAVRHDEATAKAQAAGLDVVQDRCVKIEHGRLFGQIGWLGADRRVISAKRGTARQLQKRKGGIGV